MKKKQVDAVSGKYSEKKQRNSIKNKKTLEIIKKILYNIPCVKEKINSIMRNAPLAQLVEHLTLNQGVQGSNP